MTACASLTDDLKSRAAELGFAPLGICPAVGAAGFKRFEQWLAAGYAGEMEYLPRRAEAYAHPRHVLDNARSIVMLALNYRSVEPAASQSGRGRVSRYAWGRDYHELARQRLDVLCDVIRDRAPHSLVRAVVDTAPMLEREFAALAGLGWIGKNTLLLNKTAGSWFFLCALLTDAELDYDSPQTTDHCGTCRACLEACPTDAFVDAYVLDARKCISYLTIEHRSAIPRTLRDGIGDWLFGCDVCQEVCPWNHRAPLATEEQFWPSHGTSLGLTELLALDEAQFRDRFRHTPLWRAKRRGVLRNAAIVLGNQRPNEAIEPLAKALEDDEPLVRGAAAWALGQYRQERARSILQNRIDREIDPDVRAEIASALE